MLHLQRTMGNQAVRRLIAHRSGSTGATVIQRLPKYKDFVKSAKKGWKLNASIFSADSGEKALKKAGGTVAPGMFSTSANISAAYQAYDSNRSLESLIHLYDTITYWEALNNANAGETWYKSAKNFLLFVKSTIQDEVKAETKKQYGSASDLAELEQQTKLRTNQDQQWQSLMPDFMKRIGVAPRYFGKHLMNYPERVDNLQKFYFALRGGQLKEAEQAYSALSSVPGMYLIKPLIVAHFAGNAELGALVGTATQGSGSLTKAEKQAIKTYSGGEYIEMNAQLRNTLSEPPDSPLNFDEFDAFLDKAAAIPGRKSLMETTVAGMNKLPPYQGVAYRGLVWEPGGYFDVIQPGAMIIDLAFQSASPSLKGVEHFLESQKGSQHIYFMIHTKSAVNIMAYALSAKEGEILFKPGAKFQVKAVWHHVGGKVPPNAPPEAQMILHTRGEFKTEGVRDTQNDLTAKAVESGLTGKQVEEDTDKYGNKMNLTDAQKHTMNWHRVKVIEMVEV